MGLPMSRGVDVLGMGAQEAGKEDHFARRDPYDPAQEMRQFLNGEYVPTLGHHLNHAILHMQLAATTEWATAGEKENWYLYQHISDHVRKHFVDQEPFTAGPTSVEAAYDQAAMGQHVVGPGM
jgi:hypothetical protein